MLAWLSVVKETGGEKGGEVMLKGAGNANYPHPHRIKQGVLLRNLGCCHTAYNIRSKFLGQAGMMTAAKMPLEMSHWMHHPGGRSSLDTESGVVKAVQL